MIEIIDNEVFQFKTILVYEPTVKGMLKAINKLNLKQEIKDRAIESCITGFMWYDIKTDCSFIFLKNKNLDIIIHESLHITTRLCYSRGIDIRLENDEVLTYVQGWYIRKICSILKIKY